MMNIWKTIKIKDYKVVKRLIVAIISSEWHLYGVESFLYKYIDRKDDIIIFSEFHSSSNSFRVTKDKFKFLKDKNYKLYYINDPREQYNFIFNIISEEICINRIKFVTLISAGKLNYWLLLAARGVKKDCVIVDEGVGTYYSKELWNAEVKALGQNKDRHESKNRIKETIKFLYNIAYKRHTIKRMIFKKHGRLLYPNYEVIKDYKDYFCTYKKNNTIDLKDKEVIFLSDNLEMMLKEEITGQEVFKVYKNLFDGISEKFSNTAIIWYKPHPNELKHINPNIIKAGFSIFEKSITSEELFQSSKTIICGICSTSLITGSLVFEQNVYSFLNYLQEEYLNFYGKNKKREFLEIVKNIPQFKLVNHN